MWITSCCFRVTMLTLVTIAFLGLLPTVASAQSIVKTGDFEFPTVTAPGNYPTYSAGESFGGWTVESGSINLAGNDPVTPPYPGWYAASGTQSVDLTGQAAGAIYQDLFTPGQTYKLRFAMAGNPYAAPAVKTMEVWWGSTLVDTVTFDTTGRSSSNMGWAYHEYTVMASASITRLKFQSLTGGSYGPALDDVSVSLQGATRTDAVGVYRNGTWYLDKNANGAWDGCSTDGCISWGGDPADQVVLGDWNGSGSTKIGVYRNGTWYLDRNGNGIWDGCGVDTCSSWGGDAADKAVVGDWNGSGTTKLGVYRNGIWYLDYNGNGIWDGCETDACISWGNPTDVPIVGKW